MLTFESSKSMRTTFAIAIKEYISFKQKDITAPNTWMI